MNVLSDLLSAYINFSVFYFGGVNFIYLLLYLAALVSITQQMRARFLIHQTKFQKPIFAPPISVIAPAFNEETTIAESTRSFLMLSYNKYEVIIVNDGSRDRTLDILKKEFYLYPDEIVHQKTISRSKIRGTYRSSIHSNLIVVDKTNSGKADSLNLGIEFSSHDIFCAVDSDSLLEEDALERVVIPFIENPTRVIASGGTVRVANGSRVLNGRVVAAGLPRNIFALFQIVEYTRAFLCGRIGWNVFNSTVVVSGAFGLFSKKAVIEVGGYAADSIGEDMELIVRLHKTMRRQKKDYKIVFVPDPVCWTEAPSDYNTLARQRERWQKGLAGIVFSNLDMLFNPRFGGLGYFAFPYFLFVELLGPFFEILAYAAILIAALNGVLDYQSAFLFFSVGVLFGIFMSIFALMVDALFFTKYSKPSQFFALILVSILEGTIFRQLNYFWRIKAIWHFYKGQKQWGHMPRKGFLSHET